MRKGLRSWVAPKIKSRSTSGMAEWLRTTSPCRSTLPLLALIESWRRGSRPPCTRISHPSLCQKIEVVRLWLLIRTSSDKWRRRLQSSLVKGSIITTKLKKAELTTKPSLILQRSCLIATINNYRTRCRIAGRVRSNKSTLIMSTTVVIRLLGHVLWPASCLSKILSHIKSRLVPEATLRRIRIKVGSILTKPIEKCSSWRAALRRIRGRKRWWRLEAIANLLFSYLRLLCRSSAWLSRRIRRSRSLTSFSQ